MKKHFAYYKLIVEVITVIAVFSSLNRVKHIVYRSAFYCIIYFIMGQGKLTATLMHSLKLTIHL